MAIAFQIAMWDWAVVSNRQIEAKNFILGSYLDLSCYG